MLLTVRVIAPFTTFITGYSIWQMYEKIFRPQNDEESRGDSYQTQKQIQIPE